MSSSGGAPGDSGGLRRVTSPRNTFLKLARALETKKVRRERRQMVVEGEDLLRAALDRGVVPVAVLFDETRAGEVADLVAATRGVPERYSVPSDLMARVSGMAAHPRVIAVLPQPAQRSFADVAFPPALGVWLGGVADPGNVGTLVRTAAALGADWLATGPGSADPFHPKAVRGAMGSTFALPLLEGVTMDDLATRTGFRIIAADPHRGVAPWDCDLASPAVLALGAERHGLEASMASVGDLEVVRVSIPQARGTESLNVAAAGAAIMAEALRQRGSVA